MHNVVSLDAERPRPPRAFGVPRDGARILFFTGVRYCRGREEEAPCPDAYAAGPAGRGASSERALDATAH